MSSTYSLPSLKILFVEDVSTDREMVERLLKQSNIVFTSECVDTELEFRNQLTEFNPDIILSDYRMPAFDGMKALKIKQEELPDIPFIILTGSINEDIAVECMRNGADDYVIKQNLKRLIPSIVSAMEKKSLKRSETDALKQLKNSDTKYRMLIEQSQDAIFMYFREKVIYVNHNFQDWFNLTIEELNKPEFDLSELLTTASYMELMEQIKRALSKTGCSITFEMLLEFNNGFSMFAEITFSSFDYNDEVAYQGVIHNITVRKRLLERNFLLSRAVEQSPISIVITDANARIYYVNPTFEKRTGYKLEEVIGKNPRILKSGYHQQAFYQQLWERITNGKTWQGELCNKTKFGELLWESASISPIFNSKGVIEHYLGVKEDITAKRKTLEELKIAKEKAEESNRYKSAFLATMSHELRTPLNQIIGFSSILPQVSDNDTVIEYASHIRKSGNDLLALIEDIFQMAMVEQTPVALRRNKVTIGDIYFQLQAYLEEYLNASGKSFEIKLTCSLGEGLMKREVITDKPKLIQAMLQIIRNAVKFTHNGEISLQMSMKSPGLLQIAVADTGIGIPENQLDVIFDFFRQVDQSLSRNYGGVGIGLALSKKIAEAMNAQIKVESSENEGSVFTFMLPVEVVGEN